MIIEGSFYKLTPCGEDRFDLELLYEIGGKNPRNEYKPAGYGIKLDYALKKCIGFAIQKKFKDETITLTDYLNEYRRLKEEFEKELP